MSPWVAILHHISPLPLRRKKLSSSSSSSLSLIHRIPRPSPLHGLSLSTLLHQPRGSRRERGGGRGVKEPSAEEAMPPPLTSCFGGRADPAAPPAAASPAGPSVVTSVYETHLGLAALTWSSAALGGLSLRVELRVHSPASAVPANEAASVSSGASVEYADASFSLRLRPWGFLWKRRGSKRFHLKDRRHHRGAVDVVWDLARARFPSGGGPEPSAGFYVAIVVDGEMVLMVGDMEREARRKTKARNPFPKKGSPGNQILVSRREHVVLPGSGRAYTTWARLWGKEREISIDLGGGGGGGGREAKLCVGLDGKRVLKVRRLKWKFRGNERLEVEGGGRIQVSWDVHNWVFDRDPDPFAPMPAPHSISELGHAVLLFRFDGEEAEERGNKRRNCEEHRKGDTIHGIGHNGGLWGFYERGKFGNGDRTSRGGGLGAVGKSRLAKTSSFSSSSSASSRSSWSVMEWGSAEESELRGSDGFSLLVFIWKS